MKLEEANISILINSDEVSIELQDRKANVRFASIRLTPEQFTKCLSRLGNVDCDIEVRGLNKLNKQMVHKRHEFVIDKYPSYNEKTEYLSEKIKETLPDGWVSDNYFSSQDTFFTRDGIKYAQTTIRNWI